MNIGEIEESVATERRQLERRILRDGAYLAALPRIQSLLTRLAELPGAEDVGNVNFSYDYLHESRPEVDLFLRKQNSTFPRDVVRAIGARLVKSPANEALVCKGEYRLGSEEPISLHIYGYLPESCAIVYEVVQVPAHSERRPKVVCAGGEEEE